MIKIIVSPEKLGYKSLFIEPGVLISPDYLPRNFSITPKNVISLAKCLDKIHKENIIVSFSDLFNTLEEVQQIKDKVYFIVEDISLSTLTSRNLTLIKPVPDIKEVYSKFLLVKEYCEYQNKANEA